MKTVLYRHFDADNVLLYIGISKSLLNRISQHSHVSHWFESISLIKLEWFATREEALEAERNAILYERPLYNIAMNSSVLIPLRREDQRFAFWEVCEALELPRSQVRMGCKAIGVLPPYKVVTGPQYDSLARLFANDNSKQSTRAA